MLMPPNIPGVTRSLQWGPSEDLCSLCDPTTQQHIKAACHFALTEILLVTVLVSLHLCGLQLSKQTTSCLRTKTVPCISCDSPHRVQSSAQHTAAAQEMVVGGDTHGWESEGD